MGYKTALHKRIPFVIDLALKWNSAKTAWVNHVYTNQIKIYKKNSDRKKATDIILSKPFDFHKSIDWSNLLKTSDDVLQSKEYWLNIESWVNWFSKNYMYIKNTYEVSIESGKSIEYIKSNIKSAYMYSLSENMQNDLLTFLINSFYDD